MNGYLIKHGGSPVALLPTEEAVLDWLVANENDDDNVTVHRFENGVCVALCIGLKAWSPCIWVPECNWASRFSFPGVK